MRFRKGFVVGAFATALVMGSVSQAGADPGVHRVLETTMHDGYAANPSATDAGWYREDTRVGGGVTLTTDFGGAPTFGGGSLALTTNNQSSAKAQLFTSDDVRGKQLITIGATSFSTYHSHLTGTANDDPSYQLRVDLDGDLSTTSDQTNLVYEPYWNDVEAGIGGGAPQHPGGLADDTWQQWDATNGNWWSSKQIGNADGSASATCGVFHIEPGAGGAPFTTPGQVGTNCPAAKVVKIGLNVGSSNPNYIVAADGQSIQLGTETFTWDFGPGPK